MIRRQISQPLFVLAVTLMLSSAIGADARVAAAEVRLDHLMWQDPSIESVPPTVVYPSNLLPLLLAALNSEEADLQRQAAEAVARTYQQGMAELAESPEVIESLQAMLRPESEAVVRFAAARALVVLDSRESADLLADQLDADSADIAYWVEPALARWNYEPARELWLARLNEPTSTKELLLAIACLKDVQESRAAAALFDLVRDTTEQATIRLAAAEAIAKVQSSGLVDAARELAAVKTPRRIGDRLVAASMLAGHSDQQATDLLVELARDTEPAVAAVALQRLLEVDGSLVLPLVDDLLASGDAKVRRLAAQALVADATSSSVDGLSPLLDDPHPEVREYVTGALIDLADSSALKPTVLTVGMDALQSQTWRGQEQAILLLTALDHKPVAQRLVELLDAERSEVFVTAAWGLRKLAEPSSREGIFDKVKRQMADSERRKLTVGEVDQQTSHLLEALGIMRYLAADEALRKFVPKEGVAAPNTTPPSSPYGPSSRAAAIWALGYLHEGESDKELAAELGERIADFGPMPSEALEVRHMSAVSLGRMKAVEQLPVLEKYAADNGVGQVWQHACSWAVYQISGGDPPEIKALLVRGHMPNFLQPLTIGSPQADP